MCNFRLIEVVGRGSGTQLQVGESLNYVIERFKGSICHDRIISHLGVLNASYDTIQSKKSVKIMCT